MEPIDPEVQRRVWQRVYQTQPQKNRLSQKHRALLLQCLNRTKSNLAVYEGLRTHPVYGEAFRRLADETREHQKMLRQMTDQR